MEEREKGLLDLFRSMDAQTRDSYLSYGRIALIAEDAAKRAFLRDSPGCTDSDIPVEEIVAVLLDGMMRFIPAKGGAA